MAKPNDWHTPVIFSKCQRLFRSVGSLCKQTVSACGCPNHYISISFGRHLEHWVHIEFTPKCYVISNNGMILFWKCSINQEEQSNALTSVRQTNEAADGLTSVPFHCVIRLRCESFDRNQPITNHIVVGDDDVDHFYSAHIHSIECSWRLADVLACSQKVSHPEMRLVSAAIGTSFHFSFWELWCMLVSVCFHNLLIYA
jgi:hypothetical protein